LGGESINVTLRDEDTVQRAAAALSDMVQRVQAERTVLRLYLPHAAAAIPAVVNRLQQSGMEPLSLTLTQPTLDDVFLQVTGQRFKAAAASAAEAA
jgi:ABC-2 type transport system ATP-binding protein